MEKLEESVVEPQVGNKRANRILLTVLLIAVGAGLLLPVWIVQYPPLLDYPNHLARSFILSHLHDPAYQFSHYYAAEWGAYPYLLMDVLLIGLQQVVPVAIAGKLLLSISLLAVALSCWWFVRQANPGNDWIALWGLFSALSQFFFESFIAFQLGLAACFLMIGFWLRWTPKPTLKRWTVLLLLVTLVYFSHLIGFILAGFVVTIYCLVSRRGIRDLLTSWLLFIPGCLLYVTSGLGTHNGTYLHFRTLSEKWGEFIHTLFGGYSGWLTTVTAWSALGCLFIALIGNRQSRWKWRWLLVALCSLGLYVALPYSYGETFDIDVRVLPVFFVLMLAVVDPGAKRAKVIGAIAMVLFGMRVVTVTRTFQAEQPELKAISHGVRLMQRDAKMLTIVEPRHEDDPNRWPYEHFWSWAVIERGAFSPYLFDLPGQTPMRITFDSYTPSGFWDSEYEEGDVDWEKVQAEYDYVWAYNVTRFAPKLDKIGKCIWSSGDFLLYRIRKVRQ